MFYSVLCVTQTGEQTDGTWLPSPIEISETLRKYTNENTLPVMENKVLCHFTFDGGDSETFYSGIPEQNSCSW